MDTTIISGLINVVLGVLFGTLIATTFGVGIYNSIIVKRYKQYKCIIWEKNGFGQIEGYYDQAGIFVDKKTRNKRLFLRKEKIGLNPDNVPSIPVGKEKIIHLYKTGLKNYHFIRPKIFDNNLIKFDVGEEDVNWADNEFQRLKQDFATNKLLQYMPYILFFFTVIMILAIFIYFFKDFGVLAETAKQLANTAEALKQIKLGTTILP